ncbi:DUF805 domain-containing protein [Defluviimonas sp. SAOS-178_SWC]|uniref:DUF805 domain-containing protein n=1 Tax=Defluviimonas sp. SAOS-178_SWC TaxID=3121287 RepID=UPI0032215FF4
MDISTAVRTCFSKYATFSGRARRAEFWWFALFNFAGNIVLNIVDGIIFGFGHGMMGGGGQPLSGLFSLAILLPSLAVAARRLHDTGRSGWWLLLILIPIVGFLVLIWWYATEGDKGPNEYGPDPMAGGEATESSVPRVPRR